MSSPYSYRIHSPTSHTQSHSHVPLSSPLSRTLPLPFSYPSHSSSSLSPTHHFPSSPSPTSYSHSPTSPISSPISSSYSDSSPSTSSPLLIDLEITNSHLRSTLLHYRQQMLQMSSDFHLREEREREERDGREKSEAERRREEERKLNFEMDKLLESEAKRLEIKGEKEEIQLENDELRNKLSSLDREYQVLLSTHRDIRNEIKLLNSQNSDLHFTIHQMENDKHTQKNILILREEEREEIRQKYNSLLSEYNKREEDLLRVEQDNKRLSIQLEDMRRVESLCESFQQEILTLRKVMDEKENQVEKLHVIRENQRDDIDNLTIQNDSLKDNEKNTSSLVDNWRQKIRVLESENARILREINDKEGKLMEFKGKIEVGEGNFKRFVQSLMDTLHVSENENINNSNVIQPLLQSIHELPHKHILTPHTPSPTLATGTPHYLPFTLHLASFIHALSRVVGKKEKESVKETKGNDSDNVRDSANALDLKILSRKVNNLHENHKRQLGELKGQVEGVGSESDSLPLQSTYYHSPSKYNAIHHHHPHPPPSHHHPLSSSSSHSPSFLSSSSPPFSSSPLKREDFDVFHSMKIADEILRRRL